MAPYNASYIPSEVTFSFGIFDIIYPTINPIESDTSYEYSVGGNIPILAGLSLSSTNGSIYGILDEAIFEGEISKLTIDIKGRRKISTSITIKAKSIKIFSK